MTTLQTFTELGHLLRQEDTFGHYFSPQLPRVAQENPWFTPDFVRLSYDNLAGQLQPHNLQAFAAGHPFSNNKCNRKRIAVIDSGQCPLENFYDLLYVLLSGHDYLGKLSDKDRLLLPTLKQLLCSIDPDMATRITFTARPDHFDAIILDDTQDNALLRTYVQKFPNLIRPCCHSVAIINGHESDEQLHALSRDIYLYFGLSSSSVRMLYVPDDYDFAPLIRILNAESRPIAMHNQFLNHLDYQKAIRLMNKLFYMDAGTFLLLEQTELYNVALNPGIVFYRKFTDSSTLTKEIAASRTQFQHVITATESVPERRDFGSANYRLLTDFKAGQDVLRFLEKLS